MPNSKINADAIGELKFADSEKSGDDTAAKNSGAEFLKKENKLNEKGRGNVNGLFKKKNKFPLALDIIIAILAIAIVVGAIFGAYFAFVYFSDDSEEVTLEYVVLTNKADASLISKGNDVYLDGTAATYMGSVVDISYEVDVKGSGVSPDAEYMLVYIRVTVNYRPNEGYSINDQKIAVGKEITVRTGEYTYSGELVALNVAS